MFVINLIPEDFDILSDKNKLIQLLINILTNSIKFTFKGYIKIKCYIKDKRIFFEISDSGIGIEEKKLE